ncbi:MAG: type II toxin-antitoxin system ParD family antitoxin [Moraxellaceae bacterium]|nr:MAG: type II toxin-antitoxin system ParD family antitoxin [Moraxellaceae bacterium]
MAAMNITLPDPMHDWVEVQTKSDLYANNSDYVRDLIRKDQLRVMQHAITDGIESGEPKAWSKEEFKARMKQQSKDEKL